jgi:plasmid stabilization system protein ParE
MTLEYLELAKLKFHDAIAFYEIEQKGLGKKFESEIQSSINRIIRFPTAYIKVKSSVRKCVLHTFPYNIVYAIEEKHILIIAIAHHHRKPDYWVERMTCPSSILMQS